MGLPLSIDEKLHKEEMEEGKERERGRDSKNEKHKYGLTIKRPTSYLEEAFGINLNVQGLITQSW